MCRLVSLALIILAVAGALAGCGSSTDDASTDAGATGATSAAATDEGGGAVISLPDGWTMTDALSADEVGAITGRAMEVFPEASSAAQDGKPTGSYTATGVDGSKIYFGVDVQGGEARYESQLSFADSGSATDVSGVGDQAAVVTFSDGRAGIIARKGDAVIRVDWDPKVYTDDPAAFGSSLASALLAKMFQ
jgi:hypothetical protein